MTYRTRTRGSFSDGAYVYKTSTNSGSSWSPSTYYATCVKEGEIQTTTDVVTPQFRTRIARGEIVNNPFKSVIERRSHDLSAHEIRTTNGVTRYHWERGYNVYSDVPDTFVDISSLQQEASTEAAARVATTSVDGLTEVGEARETMRLFSLRDWNLREQIKKEIRYAEKRGYHFPSQVPAAVVANNWLKYRYGIMPLVRLLHDTIVVGSRIRTRRETARGFAESTSREVFTSSTWNGAFHDGNFTRIKDVSSSVRAGILYEYRDFGNKYGFTLAEVPATIWELTPWSFVVDWFVNTGDFIRALTPKLSVIQRATWIGYYQTVNFSYSRWIGPLKPSGYYVAQQQGGTWQYQLELRRRIPAILSPTLYVRENALSEIVTSQKIVDAFALTTQLFLKLMRRTR